MYCSIIVPAHNAAWCLGEALGSVLAQTCVYIKRCLYY